MREWPLLQGDSVQEDPGTVHGVTPETPKPSLILCDGRSQFVDRKEQGLHVADSVQKVEQWGSVKVAVGRADGNDFTGPGKDVLMPYGPLVSHDQIGAVGERGMP